MSMETDSDNLKPRLLFVDDEPRVLVALKSIFRTDYEVKTTTSGAEALSILDEWPAEVIVSDQRMPTMTGVQLLKQASEVRPQTTRVLLTGYSDLDAVMSSVNDSEIFRFVTKPWQRPQIRGTIEAAVRLAREAQQQPRLTPPPLPPEDNEGLADASAVAPVQVAQADANANQAGVLILDPDPSERAYLLQMLDGGRPVFAAATLDEALHLLDSENIGTVIAESLIDGELVTSLLNGLRQVRHDLVCVVLTRQPDAQHIIDLINYGQVYRVLRKPLNPGLLRGTVNMAAWRHDMLQQRPDQARRISLELPALPAERKNAGMLAKIRQFFGAAS